MMDFKLYIWGFKSSVLDIPQVGWGGGELFDRTYQIKHVNVVPFQEQFDT